MWGMILALLSGILMSIQGVWNTEAARQSGLWLCSAFVQLTAFGVCMAVWGSSERIPISSLWEIRPWYLLLGGVLGALITITVVKSVGSLGPAQAVLLIVTAQIIAAYLIEVFGLFGVERSGWEWKKLIGAAVAIGGIVLFRWE